MCGFNLYLLFILYYEMLFRLIFKVILLLLVFFSLDLVAVEKNGVINDTNLLSQCEIQQLMLYREDLSNQF